MKYRREIDGLRALAVLPVILFHAGFQAFSGGFVGVDVFFVISGYLITSIILKEKQEGTFTLLGFYERRARRILPALFLVMFACLPFAWWCLLPADMKSFSQSVAAVSVFSSNILFWHDIGYFNIEAELKPFLHTWSLAVEEQYYLLFPIFLLLTWRLGKRWIIGLLTVVAVISLAVAQWGSLDRQYFTFYMLPTRGWEILVGAFIAFFLRTKDDNTIKLEKISQSFSVIGLLLITYAVCAFDKRTPFPSLYTLIPTLGTGLIILFATPQTIVGKLLGSNLFVGIGLISYSAYLWHFPLFVFARHFSTSEPRKLQLAALAVVAMLLAYLSWKFVETPFRNRQRIRRNHLFFYGALCSAVFIAFGLAGHFTNGYQRRIDMDTAQYILPEKTKIGEQCLFENIEGNNDIKLCYFGDSKSNTIFALYGDSHADAIFSVLDEEFKNKHIRGARVLITGCRAIPEIVHKTNLIKMEKALGGCKASFNHFLNYSGVNFDGVIVSIRWTFSLYPVENLIDDMSYDNGEGGVEYQPSPYKNMAINADGRFTYGADEKRKAVNDLLFAFESLKKPIFLMYPVPEVGWNLPRMNYKKYIRGEELLKSDITTSYQRFKQRNLFITSVLEDWSQTSSARMNGAEYIIPVMPERVLCDTYVKDRCVAQLNGVPFYFDDDHLSNAGTRVIVKEIMEHIST